MLSLQQMVDCKHIGKTSNYIVNLQKLIISDKNVTMKNVMFCKKKFKKKLITELISNGISWLNKIHSSLYSDVLWNYLNYLKKKMVYW